MSPQAEHQTLETAEAQSTPQQAPQRIEAKATIGDKGRLVIPAAIREALGLEPGQQVDMYVENHELHLSTRWNRMKRAQERVRRLIEPGRSLADELSADRRIAALSE